MRKNEDKETRYFIDLDLGTRTVLNWDYDHFQVIETALPAEFPTHEKSR